MNCCACQAFSQRGVRMSFGHPVADFGHINIHIRVVIRHLLRRWYLGQQRVRVRVMIELLVRGRVRIKIRIRIRVRVMVGVTFNVRVYRWSNCRRSKCWTFICVNNALGWKGIGHPIHPRPIFFLTPNCEILAKALVRVCIKQNCAMH